MPFEPCVELVVDKATGRLTDCFALDENGERGNRILITEARERYDVSGPGIVSIDIHTFRVKRTEEDSC
jgi:hypothetical protein